MSFLQLVTLDDKMIEGNNSISNKVSFDRYCNSYNEHPASIHRVPLTMCLVTMSTQQQYKGSRLKRVSLEHQDHYLKCINLWLQPAPAYNEHFLLHILLVVSGAQCAHRKAGEGVGSAQVL